MAAERDAWWESQLNLGAGLLVDTGTASTVGGNPLAPASVGGGVGLGNVPEGVIDLSAFKTALNDEYFFVFYKNRGPLTINSNYSLYLDVDCNADTGYSFRGTGADYLLQGFTLFRYSGDGDTWSWEPQREETVRVASDCAELVIKRKHIEFPRAIDMVFHGSNDPSLAPNDELVPSGVGEEGQFLRSFLPSVPGDLEGPPSGHDESRHTGPIIGLTAAVEPLLRLPAVYHGAVEGGNLRAQTTVDEQSEELFIGGGKIPSGGRMSPLFGAQPFEQQLIRFEEFGTDKLSGETPIGEGIGFPLPETGPAPSQDPNAVTSSSPSGAKLDEFLVQPGLQFVPMELSNTLATNPWETVVEEFLGRDVITPPAEGRPAGAGWAHQRWKEFLPEVYFKTAMAGSRMNGGIRDKRQMHNYEAGEFGPGGLYHTVYATDQGGPVLEGTTAGLPIKIHPNMPVQDHKAVWTFDGTLPPKLLMGRHGQPILMRHYNALPIDPAANRGFGLHTISTHEHNGHNPAESDGFAGAFYFPGQYWDYRWPLALAGHDTVNTDANDPRAAFPAAPGEQLYVNDLNPGYRGADENGNIKIRGDWRETASSHWFHDHMLDFTSENVYKGNAACFNYYSALDRGKEDHEDGINLRFPSGTSLPWGNRDYDANLVVADKAWDAEGQLWFNPFQKDGFLGDRMTVNWLWMPYMEVRARSYRFRLLNGSVARYMKFALVKEVQGSGGEFSGSAGSGVSYDRVTFHMVANDGNIMEHAIPFDGSMDLDGDGDASEHKGVLPTMSIAERYDIIVDFASQGLQPGDRLYLVNLLEHSNGRKVDKEISLSEVLSGAYETRERDGIWDKGDPCVTKVMQFRVREYAGVDHSMNPADYLPGKKKMIPHPIDRNDPRLQTARHRTFEFGRSGGTDKAPWTIKTDGGPGLTADTRRVSAAPQLNVGPTAAGFNGLNQDGYDDVGTLEVWSMLGNGGWDHPVHVHFEEGLILSRDGKAPPAWEWWARKDMYRIGPSPDSSHNVEMALRVREFAGTYVEHCHNTTHEDHAMLMRWDLEFPGQVKLMPSPIPTWDGVEYVDTAGLPTIRTGDGQGIHEGNPTATGLAFQDVQQQAPASIGGDAGATGTAADPAPTDTAGTDPGVVTDPLNPDPGATDLVQNGTPVGDEDEAPHAEAPEVDAGLEAQGLAQPIDAALTDDELRALMAQLGMGALETTDVPDMSHLDEFVADRDWAIMLGKSLFWDMAAGVDGVTACASCHFHGGADSRSKNQLSSGLLDLTGADGTAFDPMISGGAGGPNYQLTAEDFPFAKENNDVVSSQGIFLRSFGGSFQRGVVDDCDPVADEVFNVDGINTRRVATRNAPSVINSVFNHRNFWDGRASDTFNGVDAMGKRSNLTDPEIGVWVMKSRRGPAEKVQVAIPNSSLASQAVAPALSDFEMSCGGLSPRSFPDLGRKLLRLKALASQEVSRDDSVLGRYVNRSGMGLKLSYSQMVQKAFHREYWNDRRPVEGNFRQMEANFALFWGLAIQMYEATLVSEQTRFDEYARGNNDALTAEEKLGLQVFLDPNGGRCADCHAGPEFTSASVRQAGAMPVERMIMGDGNTALYDTGFYNIGVRGTLEDLGLGANLLELNGQPVPLSKARQLSEQLLVDVDGNETVVNVDLPQLAGPAVPGERVAVDGAFKTPTLRNVELTAPYFHNGGHLTLEQVVRFYKDQAIPFFALENMDNLAEGIMAAQAGGHADAGIQISGGDVDAVVAFMKTLTDDRVRLEQAPFDHPELVVANGHDLDETMVWDTDGNGEADDSYLVIPAVGAGGVAAPAPGFLD
jgi:cytochrome c peroxidase/FtsP/CotA-like multicopper oxidase with cupredoxin domain